MDSALGFTIALILSAACLIALLISTTVLFPGVTSRTKFAAEQMPGRSFLVGLVNVLFFGSIVLGFLALSDASGAQFFLLPAIIILGALFIGLVCGLAGITSLVGERMSADRPPWRQAMNGAILLTMACLTPFIGWFGLFPFIGSMGLGAFIIGWFRRS